MRILHILIIANLVWLFYRGHILISWWILVSLIIGWSILESFFEGIGKTVKKRLDSKQNELITKRFEKIEQDIRNIKYRF